MANMYDGINETIRSAIDLDSKYYYDKKRARMFDDYLDQYNGFIRDANNMDYESSRKQTVKDVAKQFKLLNKEADDVVDSYMLRRNYAPIRKDARVDSKPKRWQTGRDADESYEEALKLYEKYPDMDVVYGLQHRSDKENFGLKKPFLISNNDYYKIYDSLNPENNSTFKIHTVKGRTKK